MAMDHKTEEILQRFTISKPFFGQNHSLGNQGGGGGLGWGGLDALDRCMNRANVSRMGLRLEHFSLR